MRALRVVGLDEDGETVICEDPENGDRFSVPADERLRAAARGDLTRLGQVQIEMEAQMRPREIQARVRAGASVEDVATAAGIPEQRVERYAYPVLLERAQIAERSQRAHPVREDGPDVQTLGEVVAHTFGMRGHDFTDANWDAWRGEDGKWVVRLHWQAGRSENHAHWVFHPGAHGGTVAPLDDHAVDLLDPSPNRPLRTVRPVTALAREALELDESEEEAVEDEAATPPPPAPPKQASPVIPSLDLEPTPAPSEPEPEQSAPLAEQAGEDDLEAVEDEAARKTEPARRRKNHPMVPSWEDVLLGVRSHR
ncbi:septation protein SepH [Saccharopolyspora gloriosae]|uniref:septation protein SepH n=1 Tax=Saccharopolyspora gloriosae TaxID=455344 RepID=UPI00160E392F|nr:septation protein SepH [Saccharopolyspora gloriosae]